MKILLTLTCILCGLLASAQNIFPTTGNVGIGTSNPTNALEVSIPLNNSSSARAHFGTGTFGFTFKNSTGSGFYPRMVMSPQDINDFAEIGTEIQIGNDLEGSPAFFLGARMTNSTPLVNRPVIGIRNYTTELMRVMANGNVGIGTTAPLKTVHIYSPAAEGILLERSNGANSNIQYKNTNYSLWAGMSNSGNFGINATSGNLEAAETFFTVTRTGRVGIGTLTPAEALSVNGKIRAREIKVETANWPDFVFSKAYNLPKLSEIKGFIAKHRHLPDFPSAVDLENNGVNLGEINRLLTQKIEELTMYAINSEETSDELRQLVTKQNKTIASQQKMLESLDNLVRNLDRRLQNVNRKRPSKSLKRTGKRLS